MRVHLAILLILMALCPLSALATKGKSCPVAVRQPDGSRISIQICGDESFTFKKSSDGYLIVQRADGWYCYADFSGGELVPSDRIVGDSGSKGITKSVPVKGPAVMSRSLAPRDIFRTEADNKKIGTIVIPVEFPDCKFSTPGVRSAIFNLFNQLNYSSGGATGSVTDYFHDNFGHYNSFSFDVADPVTAPASYKYYGANESTATDAKLQQLVAEACALAHKAGVNFSKYDFNGDGRVDNVFIIFAGHNEAEGGGDYRIWPQSWNISQLQVSYDGVSICDFSCYSELKGSTGNNFAGIGTICHECCHFLGFLDMYDVNDGTEGSSAGLGGTLSIMDRGNYNNDGMTPPAFTIIERERIGLVNSVQLKAGMDVELNPVQSEKTAYFFPTDVTNERFYLEFRDGSKWNSFCGGEGVVIYHVDRSLNMAGSMSASMRWSSNAVNGCAAHQCLLPVTVTGVPFTSVENAFFPGLGNVTSVGSFINFPLLSWSGKGVGLGLSDINVSSRSAVMSVVSDAGWNIPVITGYTVEPEQTSARLKWTQDKTMSGFWTILWGATSNVQIDTVTVHSGTTYDFSALAPGETYLCRMFFTSGGVRGREYSITFSTARHLSEFPLIGNMSGEIAVGSSVRLFLLNLVEEAKSVEWYVDGVLHGDAYLNVNSPRKYEVKAVITYPDGSVETLVKNVYGKDI